MARSVIVGEYCYASQLHGRKGSLVRAVQVRMDYIIVYYVTFTGWGNNLSQLLEIKVLQ